MSKRRNLQAMLTQSKIIQALNSAQELFDGLERDNPTPKHLARTGVNANALHAVNKLRKALADLNTIVRETN